MEVEQARPIEYAESGERIERFKLWPKQLYALRSPANEILYGGAAGPGKSHLLRVAFITWAMEIAGLQLYLFRRRYRDLIQGHMEGPTGFRSLLEPFVQAGVVQIVELEIRFKNGPDTGNGPSFTGGSRISLNHCQHEQDALNYKTIEFHVLGLEEATEFTPFQIKFLRSRVRMPSAVKIPEKYLMPREFWRRPDKPRYSFPRCIYPTNPGGPSHEYFKRGFVTAHDHFTLFNADVNDGGFLRQYIPGLLTDNPSIDPEEYANTLSGLPTAYREALLNGSWDAPIGAFFTEFEYNRHVIPDFTVPDHWFRFRTFDWGGPDPFACHWWATSPGEMVGTRWIPRGALVCYREWYGCTDDDPSMGLRLSNEEMRDGIIARTEKRFALQPTLCDIFPMAERGGKSIADVFLNGRLEGKSVKLTLADDSRVPGWSQMRSRLIGVKVDPNDTEKTPMIFFTESCRWVINYIPALPHHPSESKPKDAAEHGESTHCNDSVRYACMAHNVIRDPVEPTKERLERELESLKKKPTLKQVIPNLPL